jgi:ubiquinone biosynthesis accessory factor UbiJ
MFSELTILAGEIGSRVLRLDPETLRRLGDLDGKVMRLRLLRGDLAPLELFLLPSPAGLALRTGFDGTPDATISAEIGVFARLGVARATGEPLAAGDIQFSGDIEMAQRFQRILEGLDIDWEEQLAQRVGDVAAHQLWRGATALVRFGRHATKTLALDASEYLHEEARLLPARERVDAFLNAVDTLRADVERLEKRVARLAGLTP